MAKSNPTQTSFLSGEWSPNAHGRWDLPGYKQALGTCVNMIPLEDGSLTLRNGSGWMGYTAFNMPGAAFELEFSDNTPFYLELTWNTVGSPGPVARFWVPTNVPQVLDGSRFTLTPACDQFSAVTSISNASPAVVTIAAASVTWSVGDIVIFYPSPSDGCANAKGVLGRQFTIATKSSSGGHVTLTLHDMVTGSTFNGSEANFTYNAGASVLGHVWMAGLSYAQSWSMPWTSLNQILSLAVVQAEAGAFILSSSQAPQLLTWVYGIGTATPTTFTGADAGWLTAPSGAQIDGPYLNPPLGSSQTGNDTATLSSGSSATPTLTLSGSGYAWVSSDVGRCVRMWLQPAAYNSGTAYAQNATVTYGGAFWIQTNAASQTGVTPGSGLLISGVMTFPWLLSPTSAGWYTGVVNTVTNGTVAHLKNVTDIGGTVVGAALGVANSNLVCDTYQLGLFGTSAGCGWPSCGAWHEGRLWLGGAATGRFDSSMANSPLPPATAGTVTTPFFSYTDGVGDVNDDNAISYTTNTATATNFAWFKGDPAGLLFGTSISEGVLQAATPGEPLSPLNIRASIQTGWGANLPAALGATLMAPVVVRVNSALIFIQATGSKVLEYFADAFSQKYVGRVLNLNTQNYYDIAQIAYEPEPTPIIWGICNSLTGGGSFVLIGCTYRRLSPFANSPPEVQGWHRHTLGTGNSPTWITTGGPDVRSGPVMLTFNPLGNSSGGTYAIERLWGTGEPQNPLLVDGFPRIVGVDTSVSSNNSTGITFYGLVEYAGRSVACVINGLDCGNFTVSATGTIAVPFGSDPDGTFTLAYLATITSSSVHESPIVPVDVTVSSVLTRYYIKASIGCAITAQGQLLRPQAEGDLKLPAGSGLGTTRRVHTVGFQFVNTQGGMLSSAPLQIGTSFSHLRPVAFTADGRGGNASASAAQYSGVYWDTIDDDWSFDGQVCWQQTRPQQLTITAVTSFLDTGDR